MRRFDRRYMMAMHCTRKLALEKILGLHYRGFEILSRVFTRPCEISPSKNSHFSTRVEKVRLKMDGLDGQLPAVLAREIYQIIREGLVNSARHAHASVVEVDLKADDDNARVTVSDNGCGFPFRGHYDDAALASTGLGPAVIKSRVAALGGALNIDSSESGARLEVTLPLSSPRA